MRQRLQNHHGWIFMIIIVLLLVMEGRNVLGFSLYSSPIFSSLSSSVVQSKNNNKECQQQKYSCCRHLLSKSTDSDNDDDDDDDYDNKDFKDRIEYLKEQYLSGQQPIPSPSPPPPEFPNNVNRPTKLGIYDNDELENLLELHGELYPQTIDNMEEQQSTDSNNIDNDGDGPMDFLPSLHELVVQTVEGITDDSSSDDDDENTSSTFMFDEDRFKNLEDTEAQQPKVFPTFFDTNKNRPNKADVYDTDELANLLELHGELYPQTIEKNKQQSEEDSNSNDDPMDLIPSLHELVVQTVEGINDGDDLQQDPVLSSTTTTNGSGGSSSSFPNYPWLTDDIQQKIPSIIAIASDVDGTLVGSDQTVHPKTKAAVMAAIQEVENNKGKKLQHFIPATGKTRAGALNSLGPELGQYISKCSGVFIQGLYCVSCDGTVIFEKKLPTRAIVAAEQLVAEFGTSIIAYDGDDLYTTDLTQFVMELHEIYSEPLSKEIPSIANHKPGVHKILICDNDLDKLATIRPKLEELALSNQATVTQAMPGMLELLPEGCSKALGVQKLCEELRIDPSTQLLAIGDAENDVEMLELSAIGVCVGNGCDLAKDAADIVLEETNDDGGAGIAIEVLGGL